MPDTKIDIAEQARKDLVNQGNLGWWVMQYAVPLLDQLEQSQREVSEERSAVARLIARVAELTAEVEARTLETVLLKAEYVALRHDKDAALALVARLRGALEPFSEAADMFAWPVAEASTNPIRAMGKCAVTFLNEAANRLTQPGDSHER